MTLFWFWIAVLALGIIGVSVLIGRLLSRQSAPGTKHQRMLALKASGALKHRKSNR